MIDDHRRALLLAHRVKPCYRMICPAPELASKEAFFRQRGLTVVTQRERVTCLSAGDEIYYISADPDAALRAAEIESQQVREDGRAHGLDRPMGAALGYPGCCVDAFIADPAHSDAGTETGSMFWRRLAHGQRYDLRLNVVFPRFANLIEHIPCSFACPASIQLVERARAAIGSVEPIFVALYEACFHMRLDIGPSGQPLAYYRPGLEQRWVRLEKAAQVAPVTGTKRVHFSPHRAR